MLTFFIFICVTCNSPYGLIIICFSVQLRYGIFTIVLVELLVKERPEKSKEPPFLFTTAFLTTYVSG